MSDLAYHAKEMQRHFNKMSDELDKHRQYDVEGAEETFRMAEEMVLDIDDLAYEAAQVADRVVDVE